MNKTTCDRCGKKFTGGAYYTIDIYGRDINPTDDGKMSIEAASQNIATNLFKKIGLEKHYCKHCIEEISNFIYGDQPNNRPEESIFMEHFKNRRT